MFELLEAEWGVKNNGLIERQRLLIEQLGCEGYETASAWIVFDSMLVSLRLVPARAASPSRCKDPISSWRDLRLLVATAGQL